MLPVLNVDVYIYIYDSSRHGVHPLATKLFDCNVHPLEVAPRWRDSQLQVSEKLFRFVKVEVTGFEFFSIYFTKCSQTAI